MGLSIKNIKKWWKMVRGKSIFHVEQSEGKYYSFDSIQGYYNDLTNKVLLDKEHYDTTDIIKYNSENYFPIAVFQYGLACYDLLLGGSKDEQLIRDKFLAHLNWAFDNQKDDGSWNNFVDDYPEHPFSSMAQGEGASLLIRGYIYTKEEKYLYAAKKALEFMLIPIEQGGTSVESDDELFLYEFTFLPYVYNGWMFSIFGLMDYVILTKDVFFIEKLKKTLKTFISKAADMDNGYWSMYRHDKTIASPFYHHLHIAQLSVLAKYTNNPELSALVEKFTVYEGKKRNKRKAFIKKSFQKIFGKH